MEQSEYPPDMQRLIDRIAPGWPPILDVSSGWYPLLARLDAHLSTIASGYVLQQCKSKFGSLSFYAAPSDDVSEYNEKFNEAIRAAEWESIETCEVAGLPAPSTSSTCGFRCCARSIIGQRPAPPSPRKRSRTRKSLGP